MGKRGSHMEMQSDLVVGGGWAALSRPRCDGHTCPAATPPAEPETRMITFPRIAIAIGIGIAAGWLAITSAAAAESIPAAAAGDVLLLDFSAPWCGPCRQMAPIVREVAAAGWLVRHVDVDREVDLVRRFAVSGVPCYVLLVKGHEIDRINGATTRGELETLLAKSALPIGGRAPEPFALPPAPPGAALPIAAATQPLVTEPPPLARQMPRSPIEPPVKPASFASPEESPSPFAASAMRSSRDTLDPSARGEVPPRNAAESGAPNAFPPRDALESKLLAATARLRVEDGTGVSRGTGTVIDCRQGEALILTCGHIFRDSDGKGRIEVDLFAPGGPRGVAGQIVAWDLKRDLALVSIFTEVPLEAVRVGSPERSVKPGDTVVTVGCDGGADPTVHHSRITAVNKYLGPANVQVAGQPVQGRSGGGLFAIDGTLIGVCNAADPADNEGLFAALPTIHEQLEEADLAFVYRNVYPSGGAESLASVGGSAHVPAMPSEMPPVSFDRRDRGDAVPTASNGSITDALPLAAPVTPPAAPPATAAPLSPGERALLDHVRQHEGKAEVICIVRPHGATGNSSEVFVLDAAGRDFVDHLARAHQEAATIPSVARERSDIARLPDSAVHR